MIVERNLLLQGEYTVDVYKGDGTLRYSLGPSKNFITSTGLSMPIDFAFADCFRYLSLGSGTAVNSITSNSALGTNSLQIPLPQFSYIGGRQVQYDTAHAQSYYISASFQEINNTVKLSRGWRVPVGTDTFATPFTFKEFMLSPGQPASTGISWINNINPNPNFGPPIDNFISNYLVYLAGTWTANQWVGYAVLIYDVSNNLIAQKTIVSNTTTQLNVDSNWDMGLSPDHFSIYPYFSLCHCAETDYDIRGYNQITGPDFSATADEYRIRGTPICQQTGAFVRVVTNMAVNQGDYMVLNYTLNVSFDSGVNPFYLFNNFSRSTDGYDVNNWASYSSGCSALLHHGLKLINPGSVNISAPGGNMTQPSPLFVADYDYGESFIGPWGCPLEPYCSTSSLSAYLSSDNLQFVVNPVDGGASVGLANTNSGLMLFRSHPYTDAAGGFPTNLFNIRQPYGTNGSVNNTPNPIDYTTDSAGSTTGDFGHFINFGQANNSDISVNATASIIRTRSISRNFEFWGPVQSTNPPYFSGPGINDGTQIRNMVLSFVDTNYLGCHIPYMDIGFATSGMHYFPRLGYYSQSIDGVITTSYLPAPANYVFDTGDMGEGHTPKNYYLESTAKLTLWFKIIWGSPCDTSVQGCPGGPP